MTRDDLEKVILSIGDEFRIYNIPYELWYKYRFENLPIEIIWEEGVPTLVVLYPNSSSDALPLCRVFVDKLTVSSTHRNPVVRGFVGDGEDSMLVLEIPIDDSVSVGCGRSTLGGL